MVAGEGEGVPPFLHHAPRGWRCREGRAVGFDLAFLDYPEAGGSAPKL